MKVVKSLRSSYKVSKLIFLPLLSTRKGLYLKISFFGLFELCQVIVGAADIDVSSDVVVLNPGKEDR